MQSIDSLAEVVDVTNFLEFDNLDEDLHSPSTQHTITIQDQHDVEATKECLYCHLALGAGYPAVFVSGSP